MQLNIITYLWTYILTLFVRSFGQVQGLGKGHPQAYWCTSRTGPPPYNAVIVKKNHKNVKNREI